MTCTFLQAEAAIREEVKEWLAQIGEDTDSLADVDDVHVAVLADGLAFRLYCLGEIVADA